MDKRHLTGKEGKCRVSHFATNKTRVIGNTNDNEGEKREEHGEEMTYRKKT
jgi:hypothetical protein